MAVSIEESLNLSLSRVTCSPVFVPGYKSVGGNSTVGSRGSVSTHTDYNPKTASQAGRLEKQELEVQGSSTSSYPHQFVHNVPLGDQATEGRHHIMSES